MRRTTKSSSAQAKGTQMPVYSRLVKGDGSARIDGFSANLRTTRGLGNIEYWSFLAPRFDKTRFTRLCTRLLP